MKASLQQETCSFLVVNWVSKWVTKCRTIRSVTPWCLSTSSGTSLTNIFLQNSFVAYLKQQNPTLLWYVSLHGCSPTEIPAFIVFCCPPSLGRRSTENTSQEIFTTSQIFFGNTTFVNERFLGRSVYLDLSMVFFSDPAEKF